MSLAPETQFPKPSQSLFETTQQTATGVPLCVGLEGTLLLSDLSLESMAALLSTKPKSLLFVPFWLLKGRANLKRQLAQRVSLDFSLLPYNRDFLDWLTTERRYGRPIWLVTAADETLANRIAEYLGLFDGVLASDGKTNLVGGAKLFRLQNLFDKGFDYAGNSVADLAVWSQCRDVIVVNATAEVTRRASATDRTLLTFSRKPAGWQTFVKALRVHQWPKNLLIFVPLITSHQIKDLRLFGLALLAAAAFSFCASAVYVINDLADLASDRLHSTKRHRAFASGRLSLPTGFSMAILALGASAALSFWLPPLFGWVLCGYLALTFTYSIWLKRVVLIDVFVLAALYTLRLVAGSAAYDIGLSNWLLSFSMFLFLSLGCCKRATELYRLRRNSEHITPGRGYIASDFEYVSMFGMASGFVSFLILPLYIQSESIHTLYRNSSLLWLLLPLLLYWISRIWLMTSRGMMNEDPVHFAVRDRVTWVLAAVSAIVMFAAA